MKKLSLLLIATFVTLIAWAAELDPNTGWDHLNPYAYDLRSEVINDGTTIRLTYKFNAPGLSNSDDYNKLNPKEGAQKTGRGIQIYLLYKDEQGQWQRVQKDDGTGVYAIYSGGYSAAQAYTVDVPVIDIPSNCKGKELTWEAVVHGNVGRTVPKIIKEATKQPQNAYGIAVNNDPMHVRFAQMFVSEAKPYITNTAPYGYTGWDKYGNNADYRHANAMLEYTPLLGFQCAHFKHWHNDASPAYFASVWDYTYTLKCTYSHNYEPNRIKVSEDGRTFVSSFHPTASCAVLEYGRNRDVYNGHHFYNTIDNVWKNNRDLDGISDKVGDLYDPFLYRRCIGMDVKGKGKDLKIILLWIDANACSYTNKNGTEVQSAKFLIYEYELGKAESDGYIATNRYLPPFDTNCDYVRKIGEYNDWDYQAWSWGGAFFQGAIYGNGDLLYNNMLRGFADLAYGSNDDVWVKIDYCAEAAATPKIVRVKLSNGTTTDYTVAKNTAYCGGSGILIKDGLLITSPTNNTICMYEIKSNGELTATNNIPTAKYTITDDKIGTWVTGFATDYAGNLFALTQASTSGEDYTANVLGIAMPYKTAITTRAKGTFTVSAPVPNILATDLRYAPAKSGGKYVFSFHTNTKPEYAEIRFYKSYESMKQSLAVVNADDFSGNESTRLNDANLVCYYPITSGLKQGKIEVELEMVGGIIDEQTKQLTNACLPRGELYWSVYVQTRESEAFAPIYKQSTTRTEDKHYRLHAAVNNYPETDLFGVIHAAQYDTRAGSQKKSLMLYGINPSSINEENSANYNRYKKIAEYTNSSTSGYTTFENQRRLTIAPNGIVFISDYGYTTGDQTKEQVMTFANGGIKVWDPKNPTNSDNSIRLSHFESNDNQPATAVDIQNKNGNLYLYRTNTYSEYSTHTDLNTSPPKWAWYTKENQDGLFGWNGLKEYSLGTLANFMQSGNSTQNYGLKRGDASGNMSIVAMDQGIWMCQHREHTVEIKEAMQESYADNLEAYLLSFIPYGSTTSRTWASCSTMGKTWKDGNATENKPYSELTQTKTSPLQSTPGSGLAYKAFKDANGNILKELLYVVNHDGNIVVLQINGWTDRGTAQATPTVEYVTTLQTAGDTKGVLQAKSSKATKDWKTAAITSMNFDYAGNLVTTTGVAYFDMNVMKNELDSMPEGSQNIIVYTMRYDRTNAREIQAPNSCRFIPERTAYLEPRSEMELTLQPYVANTTPCYLDIFRPMPNTSFSTICLPFDLDMKQLTTEALKDAEVKQYTGLQLSDIGGEKMLELVFEDVPTENDQQILKANTPYIIQPKVRIPGIIQLQKPIQFVTINEQSIEKKTQNNEYAITFKGVIPTQLIEVKYANNQPLTLLLVAENRLAEMVPDAGTTGTIYGFRGYFELNKPLNGIGARITPKQSVSTSTTIIVDGKRVNIEKYLREGRVYIRMGDTLYTITGEKVK